MDYFCCMFLMYIFGKLFFMDYSCCVFLMYFFDGYVWFNCFVDGLCLGLFTTVLLDGFVRWFCKMVL